MREGVEIGAHQPFRVVHVEDVRGDAQTEFVRLVDDGGILLRRHLLDLALPVVDPDLDDVDLVRRELLYGLAGFRLGVDLERRAPRFDSGDAFAGAEVARRAGDHLAAHREYL